MLDLSGFDAGIGIGVSVVGAQAAADAITMVAETFTTAVDEVASTQLLKKSLAELSAAEMIATGRFAERTDAMKLAEAQAVRAYANISNRAK
jgi:hypothetical protein